MNAFMGKARHRLDRRMAALVAGMGMVFVLGGCATPHAGVTPATFAPRTETNTALRTLPPPRERVTVAVYEFEDLTGQFKERETVQTLSKAVSQGGASMMVRSLLDAGNRSWFRVLERTQLQELLRERQILTEMRRIYADDTDTSADELPPLLIAPILIAGGIVGFDTNNVTGGAGARLLGIGANAEYRQDTVTVNLRAVSIKTSEVLASVTTNKTIASYGLQSGVFRFIALNEILEAEAGVSANEPGQLALQQAVDKAVHGLILEGADLNLWAFEDTGAGEALLAAHTREKFQDSPEIAADATRKARQAIGTSDPLRLMQVDTSPETAIPPPYDPSEQPLG